MQRFCEPPSYGGKEGRWLAPTTLTDPYGNSTELRVFGWVTGNEGLGPREFQ